MDMWVRSHTYDATFEPIPVLCGPDLITKSGYSFATLQDQSHVIKLDQYLMLVKGANEVQAR